MLLLLFVLLLIFLYLFTIKILIQASFKEIEGKFKLKIKLSLLKYKFKKSFLEIEDILSLTELKFQGKINKLFQNRILIKEIIEPSQKNQQDFKHIKKFLSKINISFANVEDVLSVLRNCECFSWQTNFALFNPAYTGIFTGVIWILKSLVISFFQNNTYFKDRPKVDVNPIFKQSLFFESNFEGIFRIKLGKIMFIGLKIIFSNFKRRNKKR